MDPTLIAGIGILFMVALFFLKVPVAYGMAITGFLGLWHLRSLDATLSLLARDLYSTFNNYSLTVIPAFILMGYFASNSDIGKDIFETASKWVGNIRGSLCMAVMCASAMFGAVSGSSVATTVTMGVMSLPVMKKHHYSMMLATGSLAAGGILALLIPPSITFMLYAVVTEQSVGKLFIAGILPGILLTLLYCTTIGIAVRIKPDLASVTGKSFTMKEKIASINFGVLGVGLTFLLVMGGIFFGIYGATECGSAGAFIVLILGIARRRLKLHGVVGALAESTKLAAMVLLLVAAAIIFGRFMILSRFPMTVASTLTGLSVPPVVVVILILIIWLILGCFVEALPLLLLTVPVFQPIILRLGYDPIWWGVMVVLGIAMGGITPPVGMQVYVMKGIAPDIPMETIFQGAVIFLFPLIVCITLVIVFPQIGLFLPSLMK